ncbi:GrdX family protein [Dethiothermospora halolimnae]|uniref:GrdX family protein n=1 Tax=Dethiothermospora halolimnae TaxID=3114390 RepID=UPI003CCBEB50
MIITNNPLVETKFKDTVKVKFFDTKYIDILVKVRDLVHVGHKLLSHPLSGSVKPNETPYKSILISEEKGKMDMKSIMVIEDSLNTAKKFLKDKETPKWDDKILDDFQVIDLSLIENTLENINF